MDRNARSRILIGAVMSSPGLIYLLGMVANQLDLPTKPVEIPLLNAGMLAPLGLIGAIVWLVATARKNSSRTNLVLATMIGLSAVGVWLYWRPMFFSG